MPQRGWPRELHRRLRARVLRSSICGHVAIHRRGPARPRHFRIYRYEDVIFDKRAWIADMCDTFGWSVPEATINEIADRNDVIPSSEDQAKHIRQATPGDYKRKLQPETIERLTEMFAKELDYFGYNGPEAEVPPSSSFFRAQSGR